MTPSNTSKPADTVAEGNGVGLDPAALMAAVAAYDETRCSLHGPFEQPMSARNRETIAPMIGAAIAAYLKGTRP